MQHKTGLYQRIVNQSPEDLQKWIEERKRNYPSKENVLKNREKIEEMEKRGERLHKENERFRKRKRGNDQTTKAGKTNEDGNANKKRKQNQPKRKQFVMEEEPEREDSWRGSLPHFPGTALFPSADVDNDDGDDSSADEKAANDETVIRNDFSDSEWEEEGHVQESCNKSALTSALPTSLLSISNYNSDSGSDSEHDIAPEAEIVENAFPVETGQSEPLNSTFSIEMNSDDEPPVEVRIQREPSSGPAEHSSPQVERVIHSCGKDAQGIEEGKVGGGSGVSENGDERVKNAEKDKGTRSRKQSKFHGKPEGKRHLAVNNSSVLPRRRRLTLLEKLLGPEIRHERNIILQCVRFVVEHNFFDEN